MCTVKELAITGIILLMTCQIHAYPSGAPSSVCNDLMPKHSSIVAQTSTSPYTITVSATEIDNNDSLTVNITGGAFAGFVLVGVNDTGNYVGSFAAPETNGNYKLGPCDQTDNTGTKASITHTNSANKTLLAVTWSPDGFSGVVCIKGSVARSRSEWWGVLNSTCVTVNNVSGQITEQTTGQTIGQTTQTTQQATQKKPAGGASLCSRISWLLALPILLLAY